MNNIFEKYFLKKNNLFVLHDKFTFWEFFKILKKNDYESEQALNFIFSNCSLSATVFQECIFNRKYRKI